MILVGFDPAAPFAKTSLLSMDGADGRAVRQLSAVSAAWRNWGRPAVRLTPPAQKRHQNRACGAIVCLRSSFLLQSGPHAAHWPTYMFMRGGFPELWCLCLRWNMTPALTFSSESTSEAASWASGDLQMETWEVSDQKNSFPKKTRWSCPSFHEETQAFITEKLFKLHVLLQRFKDIIIAVKSPFSCKFYYQSLIEIWRFLGKSAGTLDESSDPFIIPLLKFVKKRGIINVFLSRLFHVFVITGVGCWHSSFIWTCKTPKNKVMQVILVIWRLMWSFCFMLMTWCFFWKCSSGLQGLLKFQTNIHRSIHHVHPSHTYILWSPPSFIVTPDVYIYFLLNYKTFFIVSD